MTTKTHPNISIQIRKLGIDVTKSILLHQNLQDICGNNESYVINKLNARSGMFYIGTSENLLEKLIHPFNWQKLSIISEKQNFSSTYARPEILTVLV